tara:strand:- start:50486 stop:51079 length:594 start_codon:yes stop_codon:yes gene_type:complete
MPIEEKFAADATVKDKRVQEMAYTDVRMSVKTITETVAIQPKTAVSTATEDVPVAVEYKFREPSLEELEIIKENAKAIKEDGASSADDKGAAEILEDVAENQREIKDKGEKKISIRYRSSREMFSSIKLLIAPEPGSDQLAKILKYSQKKIEFQTYLSSRGFAGGAVINSQNLLKGRASSINAMTAPVQPEVKYADL